MKISDIQHTLETWAPPGTAWENDNIGLQIGRPHTPVTSILLTLDVTKETIHEAVRRKANLIVSHHPLIFRPIRSISDDSEKGAIALALCEKKISLFTAHTNLDSAPNGVNHVLAGMMGLRNISVLSPIEGSLTKVAVFVPATHLEKVTGAMHAAGGGYFTKYQECSFRTEGIGTFKAMNNAKPFLGSIGVLERTAEVKLEMLTPVWKLPHVIQAMHASHPYDEIAYDVYPLRNENTEYGLGVIGDLTRPLPAESFLALTGRRLQLKNFRYTKGPESISRVALCGGAGSELLKNALSKKADAFITGDIKYHAFQEAEGKILFIDAGHYETERHIVPALASRLQHWLRSKKSRIKVFTSQTMTNPVHYYHD